ARWGAGDTAERARAGGGGRRTARCVSPRRLRSATRRSSATPPSPFAEPDPRGGSAMGRKVFVIGVGMTKFEKPGSKEWDYPDMGREAGQKALADAGIPFSAVEQAAVGYCYGDSTCGERAFYELGLSGIPIYNLNNNCSTRSTAL